MIRKGTELGKMMLMHPIERNKYIREMENPWGFQKRDRFKEKQFQEKINPLSWIFEDIRGFFVAW